MRTNLAIAPRSNMDDRQDAGPTRPVYTAKTGPSALLFTDILALWVRQGSVIADVTYGRGYFWKLVRNDDYQLIASDVSKRIIPKQLSIAEFFPRLRADMRHLPYRTGSLDAIVIDPPYGEMGGSRRKESFGLTETYDLSGQIKNPQDLLNLYFVALNEARRVLKRRGIAIVKCQDAVNGGTQHWIHIDVRAQAMMMGFKVEDLFVPVQKQKPIMRHQTQDHARKNHSYFWVFRK